MYIKKTYHFVLLVTILTATFSTIAAHAAAPQMALKIDGHLSDSNWQHCRTIEAFKTFKGETPKAATTGKILTDAHYLYLAFECEEPQMDKLQITPMSRDSEPWINDCIEVFVAPFADKSTFYHLIVDASEQIYDALSRDGKEDKRYDLNITAAVQKSQNSWTLEMALPLADLGLNQARQALINFGRERKPVSENTSWHGSFAKPDTWQRVKLTLGNDRSVDVQDWDFGSMQYGENTAKSTFILNANVHAKVLLYIKQGGKWMLKNSKSIQTKLNEKTTIPLPYSLLPNKEPQDVRLIIDNNGTTVFRSTYQLNLPESALVATLQSPYYYSNETYGFVKLQSFLSPASLQSSEIRLIVKDPDGVLQQSKTIHPVRPTQILGFDISNWKEGNGAVFVELINNGKTIAHQRLVIHKRPGPFTAQ